MRRIRRIPVPARRVRSRCTTCMNRLPRADFFAKTETLCFSSGPALVYLNLSGD